MAVLLQGGQTLMERSAQEGVAGDEALDGKTGSAELLGGFHQIFLVQARLGTGIEIVQRENLPAIFRDAPGILRGRGGGVENDGHCPCHLPDLLRRKAIVDAQTPELQVLCKLRQIGAAELLQGLDGDVRNGTETKSCQRVADRSGSLAVGAIELLADVQREEDRGFRTCPDLQCRPLLVKGGQVQGKPQCFVH